ncbi:MAG TPA: serine/threonine-protein kinase [Pseudomonadota bacterium]|nr:serine/threonine-protein kinase [Pseudomonadota bacterium]
MIGKLVGHYKVVRKIGEGGMGSVWEGLHEGIGRRVAIKILRAEYSKEANLVTRFFNEARAVNIVSHPGIVGSFDYGQLEDGTAYIVMEYIDGETLSGRIKRVRGSLGPDALRIGRQIAATLAAAHGKGIIHRDMKPDNIMIVADPEAPGGERAKVLDFGIAKIASEHEQGKQNTGLTQAGAVMGTPRYMSPEQCRGAAKVDVKTDVYALGIMMFEMLTGKPPFDADGTGALMALHIYSQPPQLREVDPSIPPHIEQLVASMLSKDPAARPSMTEVVQRIEGFGVKGTGVLSVVRAPGGSAPGLETSPFASAISHSSGVQAVVAEPSGPNTTSRPSLAGVGQTQDPTKIRAPGERLKRLAIPAATAIVLSAIGLAVVLRRPDPQPTIAVQPTVKNIVWKIETTPPGAEVLRASDGKVLGVTPWRSEQAASGGKLGITLRRAGFVNRELQLQQDADVSETIEMKADPATAPEKTTPSSGTTKPGKKPGKPAKKKNDDPFAPVR